MVNLVEIKIASSKISFIGNDLLIPIDEKAYVTGFAIILNDDIQSAINFFNFLTQAISNDCSLGFIDENITSQDINSFINETSESDLTIIALFSENKEIINIPKNIKNAINKISDNRKIIFLNFNLPELIIQNDLNEHLIIFIPDQNETSLIAASLKLAGKGFFETIYKTEIK